MIDKSKNIVKDQKQRPDSPFDKNSFQNFTSDKFKDLLFNDGSMMDNFLDQIETAIYRKSDKERLKLQSQLES